MSSKSVTFGDDGLSEAALGFLLSDQRKRRRLTPYVVTVERGRQRAIPLEAVYAAVRGGLFHPDEVRRLAPRDDAAHADVASTLGAPLPAPRALPTLTEEEIKKLPYTMGASRAPFGEGGWAEVAHGISRRWRSRYGDEKPPLQLVGLMGRRQRAVPMEAVWCLVLHGVIPAGDMRLLADRAERRLHLDESGPDPGGSPGS
jgi:hypothetical protein